jgi:hypothetical protein
MLSGDGLFGSLGGGDFLAAHVGKRISVSTRTKVGMVARSRGRDGRGVRGSAVSEYP